MARSVSSWKLVLPLILMLISPFLSGTPSRSPAISVSPVFRPGMRTGTAIPDARAITKHAAVSFQEPEPIFDREGRVEAFSMPGCDLVIVDGLVRLPVKVLTFKFRGRLEKVSVSVEIGDIEELSLKHEIKRVPRPMPACLVEEAHSAEKERTFDALPGLVPARWYEYEVHYGIDVLDMARKTFVFVRIYPLRVDIAKRRALFLREAHVIVRAPDERPRRSADGPEAHMLIITSEELLPAAEYLASYRNSSGITTIIRTVEWIKGHYDGYDEQEKIRNCIRDLVDTYDIKFLLIFGDHDIVPARFAYIPDGYWDNNDAEDGSLVETDLYYADLDWSWDDNGDGLWGDLDNDYVDGIPDVFVGRLPASTLNEAWRLVGKIMVYESSSYNAPWLKNVLFIGTDLFTGAGYEGPEGEILKDYIDDNYVPFGIYVAKLYETRGTLSTSSVINNINGGCGFVNFAGHGAPTAWSFGTEGAFTLSHVNALANGDKLCFISTAACLTSRFSDRDCIGEHFLLKENGGAIVYFGCTRVAWMCGDGYAAEAFSGRVDAFFAQAYFTGIPTAGQIWAYALDQYTRLYSIRARYENYYLHWKTVAEYGAPFGDPSVCVQGKPSGLYKLQIVCRDADGKPVEDVDVQLNFLGALTLSGTTNSTGGVVFDDLLPGRYSLKATYMGITVNETEIDVPSDGPINITCALYDLVITCTNMDNDTLSGAFVRVYLRGYLVANGTTDWKGRLRLENLPAATYAIHVDWTRYGVKREVYEGSVTLENDEQSITLKCAVYDVVIEVVDIFDRPVEGAVVELYINKAPEGASKYSWEFLEKLTTGPDGKIEIKDIFEGTYEVVVSAEFADSRTIVFGVSKPGIVIRVQLNRFLSPTELYIAAGGGILITAAAVGYIVYRRMTRFASRLPTFLPRW